MIYEHQVKMGNDPNLVQIKFCEPINHSSEIKIAQLLFGCYKKNRIIYDNNGIIGILCRPDDYIDFLRSIGEANNLFRDEIYKSIVSFSIASGRLGVETRGKAS